MRLFRQKSPKYKIIKNSKFFIREWYFSVYPDVAEAKIDPYKHYLKHGWKEGRDPGPNFSTRAYLVNNPDVKAAGINPLVHFEKYGFRENRTIEKSKIVTNSEGASNPNDFFSYLSAQEEEFQHKQ